MSETISGRLLLRRFWLATAFSIVLVALGATVVVVEIGSNLVRNRASLAFVHLDHALANAEAQMLRGAMVGGTAERRDLLDAWTVLATEYLHLLTVAGASLPASAAVPAASHRRLAADLARRRLPERWDVRSSHQLTPGMCEEVSAIMHICTEATNLADAIAEVLLLAEPAAFGEGPLSEDERALLGATAAIRFSSSLSQELSRASDQVLEQFTDSSEAIRGTVIVGAVLMALALLGQTAVLLRPLARRVDRDREALQAALDRAEAADRAKSDFLSTMSHELRTPLNGVVGLTSLLSATRLDARQRGLAGTIRASAETLAAVIEDMLEFNAISDGRLRLEREPFMVEALGTGPLGRLAPAAAVKGLDVISRVDPSAMRCLVGDMKRLDHVITNLLSNAIKFTPAGLISVHVSVRPTEGGMALLRIEVRDTGPGVAPEDAERIFGLFVQGDQGITRSSGGTGLGLAICRTLVTMMGGRIGFSPNGVRGACFWVEVDLEVADPTPVVQPDPLLEGRLVAGISACAECRVALVEQLAAAGAIARVVADADALWADPDPRPPDCVIVDHNPPAFEADAALARLAERLPDTPVVVVAAGETALHHPLCTVLLKPPSARSLHSALQTALGLGEARRLLRESADAPPSETAARA